MAKARREEQLERAKTLVPTISIGQRKRRQPDVVARCGWRRTLSLSPDPTDRVGCVAMDEHLGSTLGQQGAEPWLRVCVVSER